MKKYILLLLIASINSLPESTFAQIPTFIKTLEFNYSISAVPSYDTLIEIHEVSVIPGGGLYLEATDNTGSQSVYKYSNDTVIRLINDMPGHRHDFFTGLTTLHNGGFVIGKQVYSLNGQSAFISYQDAVTSWGAGLPLVNPWPPYQIIRTVAQLPDKSILAAGETTAFLFDTLGNQTGTFPLSAVTQVVPLTNTDILVTSASGNGRYNLNTGFVWYGGGNIVQRGPSFYSIGVNISKIDTATGLGIWSIPKPALLFDLMEDGYCTTDNNIIYRYDSTGTLLWSDTVHSSIRDLRIFGLPGNQILVSGSYPSYLCLNGNTICRSLFIAIIDSAGNSPVWTLTDVLTGDSNHDQMVLPEDLLYIGVAQGASGGQNMGYTMQTDQAYTRLAYPDWQDQFPSGVNYKYCDLNADNVIDTLDFPRFDYYTCTSLHYFNYPAPVDLCDSTLPSFRFIPERDTVFSGDTVRFHLIAGSPHLPLDSMFGFSYGGMMPGPHSPFAPFSGNILHSFGLYNTNLGAPQDLRSYALDSDRKHFSLTVMRKDHQNSYFFDGDTMAYMVLVMDTTIHTDTLFQVETTGMKVLAADGTEIPVSVCTSPIYQIYHSTTGIQETESKRFKVYPNPAVSIIEIQNELPNAALTISDLTGRIIYSSYLHQENTSVNISEIQSGFYFVTVSNNEIKLSKRVMILNE